MENSKRVLGIILLGKHTLWINRYLESLIYTISKETAENYILDQAKKQLKITYWTKVEVDTYIHWDEAHRFYLHYLKCFYSNPRQ